MARLEAQRAADRRRQRTRQLRPLGLLLGGIIVVALLISVFSGGDDHDTDVAPDGTPTPDATEGTPPHNTHNPAGDGSHHRSETRSEGKGGGSKCRLRGE